MLLSPSRPPFLSAALAAAFLVAAAPAQEPARDPTAAPDSVADSLRAQIAELHAVGIRALVVGSGENAGVALLDVHPAGDSAHPALVRSGTAVTVPLGDVPVRLAVESVGAEGIRIEAPTLREGVLIAGAVRPAPAPDPAPAGAFLRHVEADGAPLDALLRLIADQTGANFSASEAASTLPVRIALRNVSPEQAVAEICRSRNLWFRRDADTGILRITSMEEYENSLTSLREQVSECFVLRYPNVIEAASVLYGLYPDRVFLSLGSDEILDADLSDLDRRIDRFNAIGSGQNSSLLDAQPGSLSSTGGGRSTGRGFISGSSEAEELRRILGDAFGAPRGLSPEEAARIQAATAAGDTVAAERLLRAHAAAAGIFITVSRRANLLLVRTSDLEAMDDIREVVRRIDVPTPMVLLEMKILNISVDDGYQSVFETSFSDTSEHGHSKETKASFPSGVTLGTVPVGDQMSFALIGRRFSARLQWLESEGRVSVVGSPTLLVANNEISRIFRGQSRPLVKNITSTATTSDSGTTTYNYNTQIEWNDVGTMIVVTPNVNADRSVTLRMTHEESAIDAEKARIPVTTSGEAGSTIEYADVDILDSRSVSGTFVVQDGSPVAIGGLISEANSRVVKRVPFLGRIPLLGWLFRSTELVKSRSELVVLVTAHVIGEPAEGRDVSRRVLDRISKAQETIDAQHAAQQSDRDRDATVFLPPAPQEYAPGASAELVVPAAAAELTPAP